MVQLDSEQMDKDLRQLSSIPKQEVLPAEKSKFGELPPKTTATLSYLTEMLNAGSNVFSVPTGVVASLLGHAYETKQHRTNLKRIE